MLEESLLPVLEALLVLQVAAISDALCMLISLPERVPLMETMCPSLPCNWLRSEPTIRNCCPFALRL
jgi:hypothetical protein